MEELELRCYGGGLTAYIPDGYVIEDGRACIRCADESGYGTKHLDKDDARQLRDWLNEFLGGKE